MMAGDEAATGSTTAVGMEGSANPHAACDAEIARLRHLLVAQGAGLMPLPGNAPDLAAVKTRADLELAVSWVLTFTPGDGAEVSDADLRFVMMAAEAYREAGRRDALLSLAEAFDDMAAGMRRDVTGSAFRYAANMARERAGESPEGNES